MQTATCAECGGGIYRHKTEPWAHTLWLHMDPEYLAIPHVARPKNEEQES